MTEQNQGRGAAYRKQARESAVGKDVTLPSGAVFVLRAPNLQAFTLSGALPVHLAAKMEAAQRSGQTEQEAFARLDQAEQIKMIEFGRKLIKYICLDPKIVDDPVAPDEIAFEDLAADDLEFLARWANSGGGATAEAETFRRKRRSPAVAGAHGAK